MGLKTDMRKAFAKNVGKKASKVGDFKISTSINNKWKVYTIDFLVLNKE